MGTVKSSAGFRPEAGLTIVGAPRSGDPEAVLDPARQRHRAGQPEPARQLRRGQPARQLKQGQRIPSRLGDDQLPYPRVQWPGQRRLQQRAGVITSQAPDVQHGEPGQIHARITGREHHADLVGRQAAGREAQRLDRGLIDPLRVIDQTDQGTFPGTRRQQAEHGQPDQEPVRWRPGGHAERGLQRVLLRRRNPAEVRQHRRAQLMKPGERELHLRLHPGHPRYPAPVRLPGHVVQQQGLAHPRVTAHHQGAALTSSDRQDEPVERIAFSDPVLHLDHPAPRRGVCGHRSGHAGARTATGWTAPIQAGCLKRTSRPPGLSRTITCLPAGPQPGPDETPLFRLEA